MKPTTTGTPSNKLHHILVVEDNPGDICLIKEVFGTYPHVYWHFVTDIIQAQLYLDQMPPYHLASRPSLVLLDLKTPLFPGHSLIKSMRSNAHLKDIKIVVFTTSRADRDKAICLEFGADAYIEKRIELKEWTKALETALTYLSAPPFPPREALVIPTVDSGHVFDPDGISDVTII
jgi:CheY-like chemotaxis protein